MGWVSGAVVYLCLWWVVFFTTLPWGAHSPHETGDETEVGMVASAPHNPRLKLKAAVTSVIAAVLWIIVYYVLSSGLIQLGEPT